MYSMMTIQTSKIAWPDLTVHTRAWELAKVALGSSAPLTDLIARAQEIKQALERGTFTQ